MKQVVLAVLFVLSFQTLFGNTIRIGVYRGNTIQEINFSYDNGNYSIYGDAFPLGIISRNEFVSVSKYGDSVQLKKGVTLLGVFKKVELQPVENGRSLRLIPERPKIKGRKYRDAFVVYSGNKGLTIVNNVSMDHYLEGVIESEGGGGQPMEYYKAQAVISRTYALKNISRHQSQGFSLCDQVHCQAYFHQLRYTENIATAVKATHGISMVDTVTHKLVNGLYFSNCGGETISPDYVWNEKIHYLQPVKDTFCIYSMNAHWKKKISKVKWRNYLVNTFFYPIHDREAKSKIYTFEQKDRKAFYLGPQYGIPLRDIRYHFKLKSTFFSCHPEGNYVVLEGRGFGHGVGLCQEGAMSMARKGYNFKQILSFYYTGIDFENYFEYLFFKQVPEDPIGN